MQEKMNRQKSGEWWSVTNYCNIDENNVPYLKYCISHDGSAIFKYFNNSELINIAVSTLKGFSWKVVSVMIESVRGTKLLLADKSDDLNSILWD